MLCRPASAASAASTLAQTSVIHTQRLPCSGRVLERACAATPQELAAADLCPCHGAAYGAEQVCEDIHFCRVQLAQAMRVYNSCGVLQHPEELLQEVRALQVLPLLTCCSSKYCCRLVHFSSPHVKSYLAYESAFYNVCIRTRNCQAQQTILRRGKQPSLLAAQRVYSHGNSRVLACLWTRALQPSTLRHSRSSQWLLMRVR